MSEFWMFTATLIGGCLFLLIFLTLAGPADDVLLRAGLWMNAIDRAERDRIMEWRRTGRLPE